MKPRKGKFGNRGGSRSFWALARASFWSLAGHRAAYFRCWAIAGDVLSLVQAMEPRAAYFRCWASAVLALALVQAMGQGRDTLETGGGPGPFGP